MHSVLTSVFIHKYVWKSIQETYRWVSWRRGTVCDSFGKSFSWDRVLCCCLKSWPQRKLQINQVTYSGSQSSPHSLATFSFSKSTFAHTIKVATKVLIRAPSEPSKAVPGRLRTGASLFLSAHFPEACLSHPPIQLRGCCRQLGDLSVSSSLFVAALSTISVRVSLLGFFSGPSLSPPQHQYQF